MKKLRLLSTMCLLAVGVTCFPLTANAATYYYTNNGHANYYYGNQAVSSENVSEVEQNIINLVNQQRANFGMGQLVYDSVLYSTASEKSNEMAAYHYFSHGSPTGRTIFDNLKAIGYKYSYAGENIAYDYSLSSAGFYDMWYNSPGHFQNMFDSKYTNIAVAISYDASSGIYYATMHLSTK